MQKKNVLRKMVFFFFKDCLSAIEIFLQKSRTSDHDNLIDFICGCLYGVQGKLNHG